MKSNVYDKQRSIQRRLVRAHETLVDANALYQNSGTNEGVVDRAYYSMLYAVFALLETSDKKSSSEDSHIIAVFNDEFIVQNIFPKEMIESLHCAFELCQAAVSQDFFSVSREQASDVYQSAVEFVKIIERKLIEGLN